MTSRKQIISLTIAAAAVVSVGAIWVHAISAQQYPLGEPTTPEQTKAARLGFTPKPLKITNQYQSTRFKGPVEFTPPTVNTSQEQPKKYAIAPAGDPNSETWTSDVVADSSVLAVDEDTFIQVQTESNQPAVNLETPSTNAPSFAVNPAVAREADIFEGEEFLAPKSPNTSEPTKGFSADASKEEPQNSIEFDSGIQSPEAIDTTANAETYGTTAATPIVVRDVEPIETDELPISEIGPESTDSGFPATDSAPFKPASFSVVEPPKDLPFGSRNQSDGTVPQNNRPSGGNESVSMSDDLSLSPPPQPGIPTQSFLPVQPPAFPAVQHGPKFNPQAGHRRPWPVQRAKIYPLDDGEKFDFETKKRDYPPFNEIIATGRFFYSAEVLWAEPQFQGNTAIATEAVNFGQSISSDFDSDFHPRVRFGFESQYGPGIEFTYFNINSNSEIASFTSDGNVVGHTNAWVIGRNVWSRIFADDPGELLASQHSIDIDSATISFFKELKFPISRINGNFGFQYVSIAQQLNANVTSAGGATVETLQSTTDMRAFGPRAIIEYYRPIGHTPLELITSFGGSVLFGQRDQFVSNSQTGLENRLGADEFLTILDFLAAVQYKKTIGENRSWFARFGFMNQTWIGGGTAAFPQGDFGLRGLTFGIGYNR